MQKKEITSIRLTPEAKILLQCLSDAMGLSQAAVLETLIRDKARKENLKPPRLTSRPPREPVAP